MNESRLVEGLASVCREQLLEEKWLLAPSLRVGHQWLEAVTRSGQSIVNVHVKSLKTMALDLAAPDLLAKDVRLLAGNAGPVLVDRVFRKLQDQGLDYLGSLRPSGGLADVIHRSIQSVRNSGVVLDEVTAEHFEVAEKGRDIARILTAYLAALNEVGVIDYAEVLRLAIRRVRGQADALGPTWLLLVPADLCCGGLEGELLRTLPEERQVLLPVDGPVSDAEPPDQEPGNLALLRWLPRVGDAPPPPQDDTVQFFHAVGEANEVREVFRRLAASGVRLDEAEMLHTDVETYVPLVYETLTATLPDDALSDGELPVTFADGIPVRFFRPGRLLRAWVNWVLEGFPQSRLVGMVREGLLRPRTIDGRTWD